MRTRILATCGFIYKVIIKRFHDIFNINEVKSAYFGNLITIIKSYSQPCGTGLSSLLNPLILLSVPPSAFFTSFQDPPASFSCSTQKDTLPLPRCHGNGSVGFSLAEVHQELQMLQRQLGVRERACPHTSRMFDFLPNNCVCS